MNINQIPPGAMFSVPADGDHMIYTMDENGSVSADGMITMSAADATRAFDGAEVIINAMP